MNFAIAHVCPALTKTCNRCGGVGHFEKMCHLEVGSVALQQALDAGGRERLDDLRRAKQNPERMKAKWKTDLCRKFQQGVCPHHLNAAACGFAHGENDYAWCHVHMKGAPETVEGATSQRSNVKGKGEASPHEVTGTSSWPDDLYDPSSSYYGGGDRRSPPPEEVDKETIEVRREIQEPDVPVILVREWPTGQNGINCRLIVDIPACLMGSYTEWHDAWGGRPLQGAGHQHVSGEFTNNYWSRPEKGKGKEKKGRAGHR